MPPRRRWLLLMLIALSACYLSLAALLAASYLVYKVVAEGEGFATALPPVVSIVTATPGPTPTLSLYVTLKPAGTPGPTTSTPTPARPETYVVVQGDTLWSIAARFNLSVDALLAANPGLNPDLLAPGDVLRLVDPIQLTLSPVPTPLPPNGHVSAQAGGLRLRTGPGLSQNILSLLDPLTPLTIIGRTSDRDWLQVVVPGGGHGWVVARWVDSDLPLESIPVTGRTMVVPTGQPANPIVLATPAGEAPAHPFLSNLHEHTREIFQYGLSLGNQPDVFSKVGDSITVSDAFLKPIGGGGYNLRDYADLQPVIDFYLHGAARTGNPFVNESLAAKVGWPAQALLDPKAANADLCWEGEAPLVCEYRLSKPSLALIMLGTNDVPGTDPAVFERHLNDVLGISEELGIVPVVSTLPEMHRPNVEGRVARLNDIIIRLAREHDVPLWDFHAALTGLPNDGLLADGIHPSVAPSSADFTPENLQYGFTVRNLTALQALDAVWRFVAR